MRFGIDGKQNDVYIEELWVEKWNGKLPEVIGSDDSSLIVDLTK